MPRKITSSMMNLLTPAQVETMATTIPEFVFNTINRLLVEKWNGTCSDIEMSLVLARISSAGFKWANAWHSAFDKYSEFGWHVEQIQKPIQNPIIYRFTKNDKGE